MVEGMTCYERDETLCEDQMCLRVGCRIRNERMAIRCGDHVKHEPTGETWVVAHVDGDRLAWCGWPDGEAKISDCMLVKKCSDEENIQLLREIAMSNTGRRSRMAQATLAQYEQSAF